MSPVTDNLKMANLLTADDGGQARREGLMRAERETANVLFGRQAALRQYNDSITVSGQLMQWEPNSVEVSYRTERLKRSYGNRFGWSIGKDLYTVCVSRLLAADLAVAQQLYPQTAAEGRAICLAVFNGLRLCM